MVVRYNFVQASMCSSCILINSSAVASACIKGSYWVAGFVATPGYEPANDSMQMAHIVRGPSWVMKPDAL
jgi:hypothetical protein